MRISLPIQHDFPLRRHNTFGIDVTAHAYLPVTSIDQLQAVRATAALSGLPRLMLGGGSNILLKRDFPGLVLHMRNSGTRIIGQDDTATHVCAAAGENWHDFVQWTLAQGWGGLENLALIPGSVGAAPIQNIGAYGVEAKDLIHSVRMFDFDTGDIVTLGQAECRFAYRDSIFKHELQGRGAILDVVFALPRRWQPNLLYAELAQELAATGIATPTARDISAAVIAIRMRKLPDPAVIGNAGSFFKNPVVTQVQRDALLARYPQLVSYAQPDGTFKLAAGWLIDRCGWKGKTLGHAGVYEKQALVLVNRGGATGQEIASLAAVIQADVEATFGVALEPEPVFV
ncbi:MAG TPA: UDP-N-acetylmuramate dehydrogenase [Paucimonas sp.]|nr:UDP-N-acetylmuramate dehydrogenase [Paucimonas sp.]HJW54620.1 UDP-N-acetylmuramate dehydrogenase [Burkholderiaceae bacterium]